MRDWFGVDGLGDSGEWDGPYEVVQCRRALAPSGLPGIDYALNPYGGCEHGCVYCYAPEVTHQSWEGWRVVKVKTNVAERLAKELPGLSGTVGIGTVTDPYQGAEGRFRLTRRCLGILDSAGFPVHIHTKSDLVLRDLDILSSMRCTVAVTVTSVDDRFSKMCEPGAPLPGRRLKALSELVSRGIDCYALVEPVTDVLSGREGEFAEALASTGVKRALIGPVNTRPGLSARLVRRGITSSARTLGVLGIRLRAAGIRTEDALRSLRGCIPRTMLRRDDAGIFPETEGFHLYGRRIRKKFTAETTLRKHGRTGRGFRRRDQDIQPFYRIR